MYVRNYRVFDRYNRPGAILAILDDDDPEWRPTGPGGYETVAGAG